MSEAYTAVDLGPERGRVVVGRIEEGRLRLHEVHRFTNRLVRVDGALRWDVQRLYGEIVAGLGAAARAVPGVASIAIDGWGADFGLLDGRGKLLGAPFHPGDGLAGAPSRLHARVPEEEIWAATGVASAPSSTLVQLHAMMRRRSSTLHRAARLLLIPDLLAYWLSGEQVAEHTVASTTQCYDVEQRAWATPLLTRAGAPIHIFPPVVPPATVLGPVAAAQARRAGVSRIRVVAPAAHDTAAALAAVPATTPSFAYVHAGREWRLGTVDAQPFKSEAARALGLANEGGVDGTVHLRRPTAGLRLVEECRRAWAREGHALDEAGVPVLATAGAPLRAAVDPDDPALRAPDDMPAAIRACCARQGQEVPATRADLLRLVVESLAWKSRRILRSLEGLLRRRFDVVHVLGAGAHDPLLCQLLADAAGRTVLAGPADASALGNLLAQAVAAGACASWREARELVRASCALVRYEPRDAAAWDEASARLERALERAREGAPSPV